ncbi:MauE/DoxX family redox-associated membrane protein [Actinomadura sp. NPDC047616]|uniref:MauE/DoxX family redox-associated membrane protein n=1 Tax=Actinomadura sp. NPDC047616 TaxID=3155914 RepID=UPI0033C10675
MLDWTVPGSTAQVCLAAVLTYSSLAKISGLGAFREVLLRLGAGGLARPLAVAVITAELCAGVMLLAVPEAWWPRALVVLLALGFAGAGVRALALREQVHCNCFGTGGGSAPLGRRQLALLPAWLAAAGLAQAGAPGWDAERGLAVLAVLLIACTGLRLVPAVRALRTLRAERAAFAESTGIGAEDPTRAKEMALR